MGCGEFWYEFPFCHLLWRAWSDVVEDRMPMVVLVLYLALTVSGGRGGVVLPLH